MSLTYRKAVRDAIASVMANPLTGFNFRLNAIAADYGVTPFEIEWGGSADNFAMAYIDPQDIETCSLLNFPAACLYTSDAEDTGLPRAVAFSGGLIACLDFWQRKREGAEGFDTESMTDAIEDAAMSAINAATWPIDQNVSVIFSRRTSIQRDHLVPLADGFGQRIHIRMQFEVKCK